MTASRVINNENSVSPAMRARVQAAIRELNYTPNKAAQQLAGASSVKIALLYDNPSASFMSEFLLGALDEADRSSAQLVVLKHDQDSPISSLIAAVTRAGIDGIILPPPLCESDATVAELQNAGVALVAVAPGDSGQRISSIRIDNEHAAREIADYLLALGHRRFGFIGGNPNQMVSHVRRRGFIDQLGAAGIPAADIRIEEGNFTYQSGLEAADRLLRTAQRPTAVFAANDDMAAAVLAVAHRLEIDVPNWLSVVGFDDTPIATAVFPFLTTVRQPIRDMATAAVALLAEEVRKRREGDVEVVQRIHDYTLVVRESSGPITVG